MGNSRRLIKIIAQIDLLLDSDLEKLHYPKNCQAALTMLQNCQAALISTLWSSRWLEINITKTVCLNNSYVRYKIFSVPLVNLLEYTMTKNGVVHQVPADLQKALKLSPKALDAWENITPLARNEWICWTISVKKPGTRINHIDRVITELAAGKRRPCCWAGCPHRWNKKVTPNLLQQ